MRKVVIILLIPERTLLLTLLRHLVVKIRNNLQAVHPVAPLQHKPISILSPIPWPVLLALLLLLALGYCVQCQNVHPFGNAKMLLNEPKS